MTGAIFTVPVDVAQRTHEHLRTKGRDRNEGVVLWIGTFEPPAVIQAIVPAQDTGAGRFRVPLAERQRITRELAGTGQMVVAQVHSHPRAAFHSWVDDAEAIPRRLGAYSLVIPDFGARHHLLEEAALFQLDADGHWLAAPLAALDVPQTFEPLPTTTTTRSLWRRLTDTLKSFGHSRT